jgi:hypothetical protein
VSADITFDEKKLMALFGSLPDKVANKVARRAVNAGVTVVSRAIRNETPVQEGTLKKSIGNKVKQYGRHRDRTVAIIGPRISGGHRGFHGHLVHNGHVAVDGSFVAGNPFVRRTMDAVGELAQARLREQLAGGIEREAAS